MKQDDPENHGGSYGERVSSVKRRGLEFRECASKPKAHLSRVLDTLRQQYPHYRKDTFSGQPQYPGS